MRIIEVASCYDNNDPKGLGRIRCHSYGKFPAEIEHSVEYVAWDDNDPFIAIPFLPAHINIIPQVNQALKIIRYDTDKDTQNTEYIAGPYGSAHDFQYQRFTTQHRDTTFGNKSVKDVKNIRSANGKLNNKLSEGAILDFKDVGFKGNYGSDIILTENGIQLRGGHLIDRNNGDKVQNTEYPIMAKTMGRFSMKKFPQKKELKVEKEVNQTIESSIIKYIFEYDIDSLTAPSILNINIYYVFDTNNTYFATSNFNYNTNIDDPAISKYIRLISTGTTPTISIAIDGTIEDAYVNVRNQLNLLNNNKIDLTSIDKDKNPLLNIGFFPFYFRPSKALRELTVAQATKDAFFDKIYMTKNVAGTNVKATTYGLVYSKETFSPKITTTETKKNVFSDSVDKIEQSFSNLSADKIYITSYSPNISSDSKKIPFQKLNPYELTQEDYVKNIEPNTYAVVRGEVLYEFLVVFKDLMDSHIHQINKPLVQSDPNYEKFNDLFVKLSNDLLNKSVRIN